PLERIKSTVAELAFQQIGVELPWEPIFTGLLQNLTTERQRIAAQVARLNNPVDGPSLPRQIARRMINQGVLTTASVLSQLAAYLGDPEIEEVMECAFTLWVDASSAKGLAGLVAKRLGTIATLSGSSAKHHLKRAYNCGNPGTVEWPSVVINESHGEPFA